MDVLFLFAHWHGLVKLHLHTDPTLDTLDELTCVFGNKLREFAKKTCLAYKTWELKKEVDARNCRYTKRKSKAKDKIEGSHSANAQAETALPMLPTEIGDAQDRQKEQAGKDTGSASGACTDSAPPAQTDCPAKPNAKANPIKAGGRKMKQLNLNTYKYHAMGDVVRTIRRYGTTDSYSTEPVCSRHCTASGN
jgi:hypothetical protein